MHSQKLYETNERISLFCEWGKGLFMSLVFVGATNVGSMTLNFDPVKKKLIKSIIYRFTKDL